MKYLLPVFALLILFNYSCKPSDDFDTGDNVMLEFSVDTLRFDTVFTELGSATRILKVYNPQKKDIKISKISIRNESTNFYKINVDGIPGNVATDIEIAGGDSLYIFSEVTIDPDQPLSNSPFVIEDYLVFETNGNTQEVLLEAWGQNANYFPNRFSRGRQSNFECTGDFVITNDKPTVFYGTVVFYNCNVIVEEGARIHVHGGLVGAFDENEMKFFFNDGRIVMAESSTLTVNGTQDNPVIMSGDRLEEPFAEIAGQWWGLYLFQGSENHKISHMEIKNSIIGVAVDSSVDLTIESSKIYNTSNAGMIGIHAEIDATNCLFYNNGTNSVRLSHGGDYDFKYCTMGNYGNDAKALSMDNFSCLLTNEFGQCISCIDYRLNANFKNSIIFGSNADEIDLVNFDECNESVSSPLNYKFENCIVKVEKLIEDGTGFENFFSFCDPCQNADNSDALFFDQNENDYHLDTLSIAEGKGMVIPGVDFDLDGMDRDDSNPDLGCYEYLD